MLALPAGISAQVPGALQRPGGLLEDARIAALRQRIRSHALSTKPSDISRLAAQGKPLQPSTSEGVKKKPAEASKPVSKPMATGPAKPPQQQNASADAKKKVDPPPAPHADSRASETTASNSQRTPMLSRPQAPPRPHAPPLPPGYHPVVRVLAPGRLDWTFVVSQQSLDPAPTALTTGYVAARQSYELYVPPGYNPRQAYPLILQVNTAPRSDAWAHWQRTCQTRRVLMAGVHNAGNDVPMALRARIVLDVLDDVRHRFHIDPDRTYITGMSGAGHAASSIAFALPELFGGHIAICGSWNLRAEQMLRQRVAERLSVAILTGTADFNRPELEREFFPILRDQHVRAHLAVYPGIGHAYPSNAQLDQVFQWLEAGLPQRRLLGSLFPASRLTTAASPEEWSTAVLLEAAQRMEMPGGEASGLFELQAVADRWRGLPAAEMAQSLLHEFDASSPVPWKEIYRTERLNFRYLQSKMFDGIVNSAPPPGYSVPRINLLTIAIALWQEVHDLAPANSPIATEASARLAALRKEAGS
ncbi:MAG TPA: hypothetical protein VGY58_07975 [Gemmataceae bacterium]|nr:hypothetical protein [Gemmataceae bacterium]